MTLFEIASKKAASDVRDDTELPDFPLYQSTDSCAPAESTGSADPNDDPDVICLWGGERIQCVCLAATAVVILALLVPINGRFSPVDLKRLDGLWLDKVVHLTMFSGLTGLYCCVFLPFCRTPAKSLEYLNPYRFFLIAGSIVCLAVGTEFLQPHFGRTFDWSDMFVDVLAIAPGFGVFLFLNDIRHRIVARKVN